MQATDDLKLVIQAAERAGEIAPAPFRARSACLGQGPRPRPGVRGRSGNRRRVAGHVYWARGPIMAGCPKKRPTARTAWGRSRIFIVDPLDGTRAYLDGQDGFAHPVCLVEDGRPIARRDPFASTGGKPTARRWGRARSATLPRFMWLCLRTCRACWPRAAS